MTQSPFDQNFIEDPRALERVRHTLAEMIGYRALLIAAGYPDGNDCDALKSDPAFKMAIGRLTKSGARDAGRGEVALVLRHVIARIRARWPAGEIVVRGDSHGA